jgi:hypothetical protein
MNGHRTRLEKSNIFLFLELRRKEPYHVKFEHRRTIEWENTSLFMESFARKAAPFISRYDENIEGLSISLDPF